METAPAVAVLLEVVGDEDRPDLSGAWATGEVASDLQEGRDGAGRVGLEAEDYYLIAPLLRELLESRGAD